MMTKDKDQEDEVEEIVEEIEEETEAVEETSDTDDAEELEDDEDVAPRMPLPRELAIAIVRMPSPTLADGLTSGHLGRADYRHFLAQHLSYTNVLRSLALDIVKLPSLADFPDAQFVEDVAVVTPEVAVITRPGAVERRGETEHIAPTLARFRPLAHIIEPGTLEGGDVLRIGKQVYVGLSQRTNEEGARQLAAILEPFGYEIHTLVVEGGLHLKSGVNYIGKNTLLVTEGWANHALFAGYEKIVVPAEESYVANTLLVNGRLLSPEGFPETHAVLREAGFEVLEIAISEAQKMDGGLTCLSLRLE